MKTVLKEVSVGFEKKNDAIVTVSPSPAGQGIIVELTSPVKQQYGKHLEDIIIKTAKSNNFTDVKINVQDNGAWDYALCARVETALERGNAE